MSVTWFDKPIKPPFIPRILDWHYPHDSWCNILEFSDHTMHQIDNNLGTNFNPIVMILVARAHVISDLMKEMSDYGKRKNKWNC